MKIIDFPAGKKSSFDLYFTSKLLFLFIHNKYKLKFDCIKNHTWCQIMQSADQQEGFLLMEFLSGLQCPL